MAPPTEAQAGGESPPSERSSWFQRLRRHLPSATTQLLYNKLAGRTSLLILSESREDLAPTDQPILKQCRQKLELAKSYINKLPRRHFAFWETIHEVDSLLLLVMPTARLAPQALEILQKFEAKVTDPQQRDLWLGTKDKAGPLRAAAQLLTENQLLPRREPPEQGTASSLSPEELSRCRYILQGALDILNQQVDQGFWQLSINVMFQILSGMLLLVLLVLWVLMTQRVFQPVLRSAGLISPLTDWPTAIEEYFRAGNATDISFLVLLPFIMLGVAGAVLSNMLSKEPFRVAVGATTRFYFYYLFVKPLIGAFAALFLLLLERSDVLLAVVMVSDGGAATSVSKAAIQIVVHSLKAAIFTVALLSVTAGFFAEKFLSSMVDRVLGLLFEKSEKGVTSVEKEQPSLLPREKARA